MARGSLELIAPATVATFIPATPAMAWRLHIERGDRRRSVPATAGTAARSGCAGAAARWSCWPRWSRAASPPARTRRLADRWGTAELQTDARVALLIDYTRSRSEAMLVNGATLRAIAGHWSHCPASVAMPSAADMLDWPRRMHEVAGGRPERSRFGRRFEVRWVAGDSGFGIRDSSSCAASRVSRTLPSAASRRRRGLRSSTACATSSAIAGPDDEGVHVEPGVGLGMRRLSIIDLSTGHQPIHNEDRTVWVVFNGEIYNYRELRRELEAAGHRFYTSSDTETIVHAYEQWGEAAFARLRGMFGLALWDRRTRTLLLARDRVGIKPLHYATRDGRLYFGSEIKSLLARRSRRSRARSRRRSTTTCRSSTRRATARSSRASRKLPPGHLPDVAGRPRRGRAATGSCRPTRPFRGSERRRRRTRSTSVLADAVAIAPGQRRAARRVPVRRRRLEPRRRPDGAGVEPPVKTFSIGFDEPQFDELEHARRVARASSAPTITSSSSSRTALGDPRPADLALRRAVRRLLGDPDLVRLGDGAAARHGRAVGRRRRRAVRRLRPLPAAPAGRAVRPLSPLPGSGRSRRWSWPLLPHGARGKNFLRHVARSDDGPLPRLDRVLPAGREAGAATRPTCARALGGLGRRKTRLARHFERFAALPPHEPDDALRLRDLPAGGRADQGRSHEHGALDRVARAAARQRGHRVRGRRSRRR